MLTIALTILGYRAALLAVAKMPAGKVKDTLVVITGGGGPVPVK
jgi:hypothetical protein